MMPAAIESSIQMGMIYKACTETGQKALDHTSNNNFFCSLKWGNSKNEAYDLFQLTPMTTVALGSGSYSIYTGSALMW